MKVPHLMSIRPMECWLATQNASSAIMSHVLEQSNAARTGVISQSASSKLSASCLHGCSVSLRNIQGSSTFFIRGDVRNTSVTIHTFGWKMSLFFSFWTCCGDFQFNECIKNSVEQAKKPTGRQYGQTCKKLEKSWRRQGHFVWCGVFLQCSEIDGDCFEIFQSQFENPRISPVEFSLDTTCWSKKQDGLLTGNTTRIFCDNVTCFGTSKCCSKRSHLWGCFKCSSLLACKAAKVQLPSIYVLQTVFKKLCSIKQGILSGTSWHVSEISSDIIWHICSVGAWKYRTWCQSGQWNVD